MNNSKCSDIISIFISFYVAFFFEYEQIAKSLPSFDSLAFMSVCVVRIFPSRSLLLSDQRNLGDGCWVHFGLTLKLNMALINPATSFKCQTLHTFETSTSEYREARNFLTKHFPYISPNSWLPTYYGDRNHARDVFEH